jgi:hypothetical protein
VDPKKRRTAIAAGILVLGLLFGCRTTATTTAMTGLRTNIENSWLTPSAANNINNEINIV